MKDLLECRKEIDEIDREMGLLLEKRMQIAGEVAEYKRATGKKVFDRQREEEKLDATLKAAKDAQMGKYRRELLAQIMAQSRKHQYAILAQREDFGFTKRNDIHCEKGAKTAFFGKAGSYTETALIHAFGEEIPRIACQSFLDVLKMVENKEVAFGVVPIENSTTGGISDTYDLLNGSRVFCIREVILTVKHCLATKKGSTLEDIDVVVSHPQALLQCRSFLQKNGKLQTQTALSTSKAAQTIAEGTERNVAAICSERAAELYGLDVLQTEIQNENVNATRFLVLSGNPEYLSDADKISICFEIPHETGSLSRILSHLSFNGLNMTRIESRPIVEKPFGYRFFVDFDGSLSDTAVKNALTGMKEECSLLRILGCMKTN